jgi:hypothetical protein
MLGISARATMGQAAEFMPLPAKYLGAFLLLVISIKPVTAWIKAKVKKEAPHEHYDHTTLEEEEKREPAADPSICAGST